LNDDALSIVEISAQCDALGMDSITAGSTIAFATYLRDQGVLDFDLRWGDARRARELVQMIARREDIGDLLAEGTRAFGARCGMETYAVQVNGLELAMHDPRAVSGMVLVYVTSPIGASHNHSDYYWLDQFYRPIEDLGIPMIDRFETQGKAINVARHQDWRAVTSSLVMCILPDPSVPNVVQMIAAATGHTITMENVLTYGERIMNLKRALNLKLGYNARANEKLPLLVMQPLAEGGTEGHAPELEPMLREYYAYRDWDWTAGKPSREKLRVLGMTEIARELWKTRL
jgi:aldehyde:ferredoxin oxidoreductase